MLVKYSISRTRQQPKSLRLNSDFAELVTELSCYPTRQWCLGKEQRRAIPRVERCRSIGFDLEVFGSYPENLRAAAFRRKVSNRLWFPDPAADQSFLGIAGFRCLLQTADCQSSANPVNGILACQFSTFGVETDRHPFGIDNNFREPVLRLSKHKSFVVACNSVEPLASTTGNHVIGLTIARNELLIVVMTRQVEVDMGFLQHREQGRNQLRCFAMFTEVTNRVVRHDNSPCRSPTGRRKSLLDKTCLPVQTLWGQLIGVDEHDTQQGVTVVGTKIAAVEVRRHLPSPGACLLLGILDLRFGISLHIMITQHRVEGNRGQVPA